MDNWEKIRQEIEIETKEYFKNKEIDIGETVNILQKVLMAFIDEHYQLNGVAVNLPKAMYDILDEDTTKKEKYLSFSILYKVEPFLKKMLFFLDRQSLNIIVDEKKGLAVILKKLRLFPGKDESKSGSEKKYEYYDYGYHLNKIYNLRNKESHDMELWSNRELDENIESLFIFYLEAINRHKENLIVALAGQQNDFSGYVSSVVNEFEIKASHFTSTKSIEDYSVFESYAIEHNDIGIDGIDEEDQERFGTVDDIRKNSLPEKRMLLWGDAGMGKSTTLQYLAYIDAKDYLNGVSMTIPVYVPLGMMIEPETTLIQYVCKILGVEYLTCLDLFNAGKISLFLDGINEIPKNDTTDVQSRRLKEIQSLLNTYPKMLVLISNRPEKYSYFTGTPVFRLQKMDLKTIKDFLEKNTDSMMVRDTIIHGVEKNHRLLQLIGTPLMATRLIDIVRDLNELPQSEGTIIKKFLECLYKRERFEKMDTRFDEFKTHHLLTYLAVYGFRKNGTNSGVSYYEVLNCFAECMEKLHFSYDSTYALETLISLGVLSSNKEKEVVAFSHQAYQDYYLSCAGQSGDRYISEISVARGNISKKDEISSALGLGDKDTVDIGNEKIKTGEEIDKKQLIKNSTEVKPDSDIDGFYRQHANDAKYEKSIIYKLHTLDRGSRNKEIKLLAEYNLLLAAKAISSGEEDPEIEEYVVAKTVDKIRNSFNKAVQLEGLFVFLELDRANELMDNIAVLLENGQDGLNTLGNMARALNDEQCVIFLDALCQQDDVKNLKTALSIIIQICSNKDYEYTWNISNHHIIERIANRVNNIMIGNPYALLRFYLMMNVPKELLVDNITDCLGKVIARHLDLVEEVVRKYNIVFDLSPLTIIDIDIHSGAQKGKLKAFELLSKLDNPLRLKLIRKYFTEVRQMRAAVYHALDVKDQYEITKKYNVFYYLGKSSRWKTIPVISRNEAYDLLSEQGMLEYYEIDIDHKRNRKKFEVEKNFANYMRELKPEGNSKSVNELLQESTLDDFLGFKKAIDIHVRSLERR